MRSRHDIDNEIEGIYSRLERIMPQPVGVENSELERSLRERLKNLQEEAAYLIKPAERNLATIKQGLKILGMIHKRREKI